MLRRVLCLAGLWVGASVTVSASPPTPTSAPADEAAEPLLIQMTIHPAAEPRPARRYLLLPPLTDQTVGNAAVLYEQAALMVSHTSQPDQAKLDDLLEAPLAELDVAAARALAPDRALRLLGLAARRDRCTWDLPYRERLAQLDLPGLGPYHTLGRMQVLMARVAIGERRYVDAVQELQTVFALARDVGRQPSVISGLMGLGIARRALDVVRELQQQPDAPNLYWALASLPRPLVDLKPAAEAELSMVEWMVPEVRGVDAEKLSAVQWQQINDRLLALAAEHFAPPNAAKGPAPKRSPMDAAAQALVQFPAAKKYLVAQGKTPAQVEAMQVHQVLAAYQIGAYQQARDDLLKWLAAPYPQALAGFAQAERQVGEARGRGEGMPYSMFIMPIGGAIFEPGRVDRQIAAQQVIEALRMYAASHNGEWPATLADVTAVPAPGNPLTGQPFGYERRGRQAVLSAPAPANYEASKGLRFEIALEPLPAGR